VKGIADRKTVTRNYARHFRGISPLYKTMKRPTGVFEYVWTDAGWAFRQDAPVLGYLLHRDPYLYELPKPAGVSE
jgi:hypothetical protein